MSTIGMRGLRDVLGCYATGRRHCDHPHKRWRAARRNREFVCLFVAGSATYLFPRWARKQISSHTFSRLSASPLTFSPTFRITLQYVCAALERFVENRALYRRSQRVRSLCRCPGATGVLALWRRLTAADHRTFFGEVTQMHLGPPADPFTFSIAASMELTPAASLERYPHQSGSLSDFAPTDGVKLRMPVIDFCFMQTAPATIDDLVVAGWTRPDSATVEHHIADCKRSGSQRPRTVPCFYRVWGQPAYHRRNDRCYRCGR